MLELECYLVSLISEPFTPRINWLFLPCKVVPGMGGMQGVFEEEGPFAPFSASHLGTC